MDKAQLMQQVMEQPPPHHRVRAGEPRLGRAKTVFILAFGESLALHHPCSCRRGDARGHRHAGHGQRPRLLVDLAGGEPRRALGDWVSYWLGAHFPAPGRRLVAAVALYPQMLPKGEALLRPLRLDGRGDRRFSGPLRATVPLAAGITRMPIVPFQLANVGSAFLWAATLMIPGVYLGKFLPV